MWEKKRRTSHCPIKTASRLRSRTFYPGHRARATGGHKLPHIARDLSKALGFESLRLDERAQLVLTMNALAHWWMRKLQNIHQVFAPNWQRNAALFKVHEFVHLVTHDLRKHLLVVRSRRRAPKRLGIDARER